MMIPLYNKEPHPMLESLKNGPLGRRLRPAGEALYRLLTPFGIERAIDGEQFRIDPRVRYLFSDARERELRALLRERLRPEEVVLDVGSHAGLYVLLFARWAARSHIHAFEPNPATRAVLARHVRLNGLGDRVVVNDMAVSDRVGSADLFALPLEGMSRLGSENRALEGRTIRTLVPTTTLDAYCEARDLDPTWLRLDIEGFEFAALRGAARLISRRRGRMCIVVEMHPGTWEDCGENEASASRFLSEVGLEPVPLTGQNRPLADYGIVRLAYRS